MAGWHAVGAPRGWVADADQGWPGPGRDGGVGGASRSRGHRRAGRAAASCAIEAALDGEPQPGPFRVLARRAQREMLRLVPPDAGQTG